MDMGQEEQHEVSDPDAVISAESVAASSDAQPYGIMEGLNKHNANDLICLPAMYLEGLNSMPIQMHIEVVEQNLAIEGVAAQLDPVSCFDPEALDDIPEDTRMDFIVQEQEKRRVWEEDPAYPYNAE